ncbi:MAG TPA: hypothetical protein DCP92_06200 [Nitrospiraceae bacterium]|jgi:ParB family chromosome partitioning protein|nr:hypothetical protein [Nitrospiraceae bacterium]
MGKVMSSLFSSKKGDAALQKILEYDGRDIQQREKTQVLSEDRAKVFVPVDQIVPNPFQPRHLFVEDKLKTLAESIRVRGMLQPVLVRRVSASPLKYEVIAGERRLRAARIAGLSSIPVIVKDAASDIEMRIVALSENLQREDLTVVEKTKAIGQLFNDLESIEKIAAELGLCQRIVERYMKIYRVIYASPALSSVFERQADFIDFKTAETMASIFENIENATDSREKFFELVNAEGIKSAIKYFMHLVESKTPRKMNSSFNIAVRKDELIFTVRHDRSKEITPEGKREILGGLEQFFGRIRKDEK